MNVNKLNVAAFIIITVSVLAVFILTAFFQFYTYADDGKILGEWRSNETMIYLGTVRVINNITGLLITLGVILLIISSRKIQIKPDVFGLLFIVLGTLTIIGTLSIFYPCKNMMPNNRPMICYWTMKVLLLFTHSIVITGLLMQFSAKSVDFIKGLNITVIIISCISILIITRMSGLFCLRMTCVELYRPFILAMSFIFLILSLLNMVLLNKKIKQSGEKNAK